MGKRKIYIKKYEKAISHLKCNSEIDKLYFEEIKYCLRNIKQIKGSKEQSIKSYFDHIDFILKNTFGVEVEGVKELTK